MERLRYLFAAPLLAALALTACSPPKYVPYTSVHGDWRSSVPWHWDVMTDQEDDVFTNTNLIGPFEPDFYLGAPSFSVRWHAYKRSHTLPSGFVEYYQDVDDYIDQMLKRVYGPDYHIVDEDNPHIEGTVTQLRVAGRMARHFVVLSAVNVPDTTKWGTSTDAQTNKTVVVRRHEYVIVPEDTGFYVLIYPATLKGFDLYKPQFNNFVHNFTILKTSPFAAAAAPMSGAAASR